MSEANKQYQVNSNDLITVADAIRLRTGETRDLIFPDEFVVGINSIAGTWRPIHVNGTEILSTDPASGFLNLKIASGSVNILGITATSATGGKNAEFGIRVNSTYFSSDAQNGLSLANSWISTLVTNPMQAANDLIVGGTSGAPTRLAGGSVGQVLGIDSNGNIGWLSEAHTGTVTSVTLTQGAGITVSDSGVAITSSGTREISLNIASTSALGGIRVGEGLMATAAGVLSIDSTTAAEGDVFIRDTDGFAWTHQYTAYNTSSIPWGKVNTTSTSTLFTATVPGVSAYRDGVSFWLKNGVVTSASGFTININGLGAKKVYSNMAPTTRDTTIFNINYTMLFVYDAALDDGAGAFVCYRGYDANTNTIGYQVRTNNSSVVAQSKFYRYRLLFTSPNGTEWVPANTSTSTNATAVRTTNQAPIDPFGPIVWYGTTTAVDAGTAPGAAYLWQQYYSTSLAIGYSFNRTGAAATMTAHLPVYLKCAPQADGSAIIDAETPYVQALPATADGKIYILLGRAVTATCFELLLDHPVYAYINGHVQAWAPYAATAGSAGASTSAIYDGGLNPQQKISEWYGHSISVSGHTLTLEDANGDELNAITLPDDNTTYTLGTGPQTVTLTPSSGSVQSITVPYATSALKDDGGNQITTHYGHILITNGNTIGLEDGNGDEITGSFITVPYATAAGSASSATSAIYDGGLNPTQKISEWYGHSLSLSNGVLTLEDANGDSLSTVTLPESVTYTLGTSGNNVTLTPSTGSVQSITVPYATKALGDDGGNQISTYYGHKLIISGNTLGLEDGNGDELSGSFVTVPYASTAGSVAWANVSGHAAGVKEDLGIAASGTTFLRKDGTWVTPTNTTYSISGALASHVFTTTLTAVNPAGTSTATIGFVAGDNITLTDDTTNKTITIAATDTTYTFSAPLSKSNSNVVSLSLGTGLTTSNNALVIDSGWFEDEIADALSGYVQGSGTSGYLAKWNGTGSITNGPQLGSSTTTYLRNDGSWATPPNTWRPIKYNTTTLNDATTTLEFVAGSNIGLTFSAGKLTISSSYTNTTYTLGTSGNTVTLTPSSGSVQSITVPYATNARNDDGGNQISVTYGHALIVSGNTVGLEDGNGDEITGSFVTVPYATAAGSVAWTNVSGHAAGVKDDLGITTSGTTFLRKDGTWATPTDTNTTYSLSGALASHKFTTTLTATNPSGTSTSVIEFVAGSNVTLTDDTTNKKITIAATDTTYTLGTGTNTVTLTPSSGTAQSITVPYATAARNDDGGNQISTTYAHSLVVSGTTVGLEDGNGDEITGSFITIPYATAAGNASTADTANSVAWANVSGHAAGVKSDLGIASSGTTFLRKDGTWATPTDTNTTYAISGALASHKFTTTLTATNPSGTSTAAIEFVAGSNVTLTDDTTNKKITIASANTTYTLGTNGNTVTLTPSSGSVQSITVPYATKALGDDAGNQITTTYGHALVVSGNTVGLEDGNGDSITGSFVTVPYATAAGSATTATTADTANSVAWANVSGHAAGVKSDLGIATSGSTFLRKDGQWATPTDTNTTYSLSGALSSHKFTTTLTATNPSGTSTSAIEFVAGGNITLTDDTANKKITIAATDTTYTFSAPLSKNSSNVVSLSLGTGLTTSSNALVVDSGWLEDEISDALTGYVKGSGTSGYLAKWNGSGSITNGPQLGSSTTTYLRNDGTWATPTDTNNAVTQTATTTNATYEVLFSNTADNTTRTEGARKNNNLLFNPSTGTMSTVIYTMMVGTTAKARMNYDNTVEAIKFTFV